jgi:hypothetical protein
LEVDPLRTLAEGPFGIESQKDAEEVTLPLRRMVMQDNAADAFVIACFSLLPDPLPT